MKTILLLISLLIPASGFAQQFSIGSNKIAGGGGTSVGGIFQVTGTIGQPDAMIQPASGGIFSVTGGFWSIISVVQTPGTPALTITHSGNNVIISWPNLGTYTLQQNQNIAASTAWTTSGYSVSTNNGISSVTITSPTGYLFFRLASP